MTHNTKDTLNNGVITSNIKMINLVRKNNLLLSVINRFDIRLGFGDATVRDACIQYDINEPFFLAIINTYVNEDYFPEEELRSYPAELWINYLIKNHDYYKNFLLADIEHDIERLLNSIDKKNSSISLIRSFFSNYKIELLSHLQYEEEYFFPLVSASAKRQTKKNRFTEEDHLIHEHRTEHDKVLSRLQDLSTVIIKHFPPDYDPFYCNHLLSQILAFEFDLKAHERLEDNILLPLLFGDKVPPVDKNNRKDVLSRRETDVIKLVAAGLSNKEIAEKLFISPHTVISHRKKITEKLGIKTVSGLTIYAILNKLIDPENIEPETVN